LFNLNDTLPIETGRHNILVVFADIVNHTIL